MSAQLEQPTDQASAAGGWCPMCRRDVDEWAPGPNGRANAQCPHCESLERNRLLILALDRLEEVFASTATLVDVAPTPGVDVALVRHVGEERYIGFDLGLDNRDVKVLGDLTRMPFPDQSVDVLVAFHVLEHIPDDMAAMAEIRRVLGSTGIGLLQVPIVKGPTDEDPDASIEERIARFGRYDHVRMYGDDWEDRLRRAGFGVARFLAGREFTPHELRRANTHGRFWLVTGVATDPSTPDEMIAALVARRRSAGLRPSDGSRPSAEARMLAGELRAVRRQLAETQRSLRQMRRRARRAEAELALVRSGPGGRLRVAIARPFGVLRGRRPREILAAVPTIVRDPKRLARRLGAGR